jgi:hypothetical protein
MFDNRFIANTCFAWMDEGMVVFSLPIFIHTEWFSFMREIGFTHIRICEVVDLVDSFYSYLCSIG